MEILETQFWTALLFIIIIDLVLAGDNAAVIGMSARNLPRHHQRKAILWGTAGAIVIRVLATFLVVWLLKIPGLLLAGGLLLAWIAFKLLTEQKHRDDKQATAANSLWAAIRTIIIADAVMGMDNVLAVAGAAKGSVFLIIIGLLISIPIMVWGSFLILKLIERFPITIYVGGGILAFTAGQMITDEPLLQFIFADNMFLNWLVVLIVFCTILFTSIIMNNSKRGKTAGQMSN